jgi:hypothetical protein
MMCLCTAYAPPAKRIVSNAGIVYQNPRVFNVDYSFEMVPDPNTIDRAKDLKVWMPIPREWDSQKAVRIISVRPEPHARYVDPEYGNPMLFWDFDKEPKKPSYKVDIKFRLESYDVIVQVDPNRVGPYDKTSNEYDLYTHSSRTIHITPKVEELAREAVGDETNPYRRGERIVEFVGNRMRFKILDFERGRGTDCLLAHPVIDEKTGQEYYEGCCNQYAALMVALCRAVGIPARCVFGFVGGNPWIEPNDVKAKYPFETKLSPDGLAATQLYGDLDAHVWGEFFIPGYGWIPADPTGGMIGRQSNQQWIQTKGRDILLGPAAPLGDGAGYGSQWVALQDGRADLLFYLAANIARIRTIKATVLYHCDPFPADGLASYEEQLHPVSLHPTYQDLGRWRQGVLNWFSCYVRNLVPEDLNLAQFYKDHPSANEGREAFICRMLHRQLGDEKFSKLTTSYLTLRQRSGQAVPVSRFQDLARQVYGEPLDWFFKQWVNNTDLPRLKLEKVTVLKDQKGWQIQGCLVQSGDSVFRLPLEFAIDTKNGKEQRKLWIDRKATDFAFHTLEEPHRLIVDPDFEILKVQKMAPHLWWFEDIYPKIMVIYGTLAETEANKTAAERLNNDWLGLAPGVCKADIDVDDTDLQTECIFLVGRPETNKIAQKFQDLFPIKFEENRFTWQGTTYAQSTQAVAQMVENPGGGHNLIIMLAGLSPAATQGFPYPFLNRADRSYVVFDGDKPLLMDDWEDVDADLCWRSALHASPRPAPNLAR